MVVDAAAEGAALQAAEIAALIGERGLGGDDVDLRIALTRCAATARPRARDARGMAQRWAEIASAQPRSSVIIGTADLSVGALLALAYPERIAKNRGGGVGRVSARSTAAAPMSIAPRRWRASRSSRSPSSPAAAARAASC